MERLTANHGGEMIQKFANVRDSEFARLLAAPRPVPIEFQKPLRA